MPAQNYVLLERVTVGEAGASSITFNSIPQTGYTDLKIVCSSRAADSVGAYVNISFNGLTTNLSSKTLRGSGSAVVSQTETTLVYTADEPTSATASTFSNSEFYIPNYTSANYKSISTDGVSENNATAAYMFLTAGLWSSTAAITSIKLTPSVSPFAQYSSFSLYGLAAVGTTPTKAPKATGGSIIQTDGTYWYHAFLASGTFTPAVGLSCDVLVVGGGGGGAGAGAAGGGYSAGSGGGAGGYRTSTSLSLSTATSVTVGAGGAAGINGTLSTGRGTVGVDSVFSSITSTGGGGGGVETPPYNSGTNGGSGGGANQGGTAGISSPVTSPVQGYAGGVSNAGASYPGAGGGGATAVGATVTSGGTGGAGGAGSNSLSSWATATNTGVSGYYAGGGGGGGFTTSGGAGGSGGGGAGGANPSGTKTAGTAGTPNVGAGGGGASGTIGTSGTVTGGNGGSGIVIIRYAV